MVERRGTKALELWCRRITDGYPGVNVINMTTSWRDGLAFCAMIHHFRPDLIDFNSLNKDDIYGNNELAFRIAEQHLNIPALLDAEDMATCKVPDRLSILTYLSQFYQVFGSSPSRLAMNRTTESASERIAPVTEPSQPKVSLRQGMRREPCTVCGLPVFLAEKLVIARSPYHRTCFRCARCHNQLTPGNYYETEGGEFCCETCPDEVYQSSQAAGTSSDNRAIFPASLDVPLSDEEKSSLGRNASLAQIQVATQRLRLDYMADDPPPNEDEELSIVDGSAEVDEMSDEESDDNRDEETSEKLSIDEDQDEKSVSSIPCSQDVVNRSALQSIDDKGKDNQHPTAISSHDLEIKEIEDKDNTKDTLEDRPLSFVQQRLKMFEGPTTAPNQQQLPSTANRPTEPSDLSRLSQEPLSLENQEDSNIKHENKLEEYPEDLNPFSDEVETNDEQNPFGDTEQPKPAARSLPETPTKKKLEAPKINLNPFWSDEEGPESEEEDKEKTTPVPRPRTVKQTQEASLSQKLGLDRNSIYASNTSITSSGSATTSTTPGGSYRKKKPAPQPPTPNKSLQDANQSATSTLSLSSSILNISGSTSTTPRARKTKPAPPPPMSASTPQSVKRIAPSEIDESSVKVIADKSPESKPHWTDEKLSKDEANRNRQSLMSVEQPPLSFPDKSVEGKWKRKKGPAPPRPTPHRRKIKVISIKDLKFELDEIELQQQGLEKQGVRLEQIIREKCESQVLTEDASLGVDVEDLVMELFTLVNEKNELFRRQAELMLLRRQYRLEEEHADIEYQIRCLMCQPEATKTDFDKQREEALIQRLVEIVERRNEIVECLEMDRKREVEEDRSIHTHMGLYAAKNKGGIVGNNNETVNLPKKKNKLKEKLRERKLKKSQKKDADKDVDEAEAKLKRNTKRKWF